jgi:hypothetical protein
MAGKGAVFPAAMLALCLFSATVPGAQEGDYFLAGTEEDPRFIQRLSWGHDDLALRYEVILEEERDGRHVELLRKGTEQNHLSLSLPPGRYRYAVGVYNLLDKLEYTMDRVSFEVLRALRPEILSFSPEEFFLDASGYGGSADPLLLSVNGQDIADDADSTLRALERPGVAIRPRRTETQGDTLLLVFDGGQLEPGDYEVYVKNPGGLDASRGTLVVRIREKEEPSVPEPSVPQAAEAPPVRPDVGVSAGYAPLMYLYGALLAKDVFEGALFPLGAAAQIYVLPLKLNRMSLGVELGASWHRMEEDKAAYKVSAQLLEARLSLLFQRWLLNRIVALNLRLGAGMLLLKDFQFDYGNGADALDSMYPAIGAGLSFQWLVAGGFFIEAGATFTHLLSSDDSAQPGCLQPVLSAGWKW